ncbi:hypothetical protein BKA81DRAFT_407072 [Phyllosticta paracitricarpa]|uniref:Inner centromere protein ARK-binding domain-containing protein n=1 Tax=Phyllosticta paracitricarpa TaxID=2016321 RepID=A0ABR1MZE3_9PEZI
MSRNKVAVGSAPWILSERQQVDQFVEQEAEEFSYSVRNELEWLNEHMADIFSQNQVNVADVFKTPGKLRGKTPRTVRKKNPMEIRAPLTDIFAPNLAVPPSPAPQTQFYKQVEQIQIAEDPEPSTMPPQSQSASEVNNTTYPMRPGDSGYHGMTEDEMEVEHEDVAVASPRKESPAKPPRSSPLKQPEMNMNTKSPSASFVSAAENVQDQEENANATPSKEESDAENMSVQEEEMDLIPTQPDESPLPQEKSIQKSPQYSVGDHTASAFNSIMRAEQAEEEPIEEVVEEADEPEDSEEPIEPEEQSIGDMLPEEMEVDGARTPSEQSSPEKPFFRKSSITFSALPAREPLKKSMGSQGSRISQAGVRNSYIGRLTGGKSLGGSHAIPHGAAEDEAEKSVVEPEELEASKLHSKTSTQRLHERINMLAQPKEPRSSKSIPSIGSQEPNYPQLPVVETSEVAEKAKNSQAKEPSPVPETQEEDDDDWIAPVSKPLPPQRPVLRKSQSVDVMEDVRDKSSIGALDEDLPEETDRPSSSAGSPAKAELGLSRSKTVPDYQSPAKVAAKDPQRRRSSDCASDFGVPADASTPFGSPQRATEGTQSAKSKFYSVLKSAKSIFASSAGVSAQAKMEALSPATMRLKQNAPPMEEVSSPRRPLSSVFDKPVNTAPPAHRQGPTETPVRRTRASFEREERQKEREAQEKKRAEEELEKLREQERKRAAETAHKEKEKQAAKSGKEMAANSRIGATGRVEPAADNEGEPMSEDEAPASQAIKSQSATGTQKPKEPRSRLVKPSKESIPKPRTHIKVGLGSHRGQPTNADLSKSLHGTLAPASKPAAESTTNSFSRSIGPSSAPVAKPNSLALAAKNKEKEEREAQRKAEKKRQIEQQRAAKLAKAEEDRRKAEEERRRAEEERRAEVQRKAEEQKRAQEAKRAANRQALAAEARKQEQMRSQAASRQANDLATQLQHEKSKTLQSHPRGDMAGARPVSRMNTVQDFSLNRPVNPAKPAKRVFQPDEEETVSRPQVQRNLPTFQRLDAKRRKTDEDEETTDARRSMMAPPIRQSNVRKLYPERERIMSVIEKAKDGPNKYSHGYMSTASGSHTQASSMLKQTVTAQHHAAHNRPGGHPNDMATISKAKIPFADPPASSTAASSSQQTFKTPMGKTTTTTVKTASPHFPTPELPEIATDSEDEDSDSEAAGFRAPSWVNSPALRDLLTQQQLVDPMEVFGPIAPLQMEEIFKNKERHKRFRERTSSANWSGNDRLTEDERKKDREARERMMKDGGWTYGNAS